MAERLSDEDARAFAPEAFEYARQHGGSHNSRPRLVQAFAHELGMDLRSADLAMKAMQEQQGDSLSHYGLNYLVRTQL